MMCLFFLMANMGLEVSWDPTMSHLIGVTKILLSHKESKDFWTAVPKTRDKDNIFFIMPPQVKHFSGGIYLRVEF